LSPSQMVLAPRRHRRYKSYSSMHYKPGIIRHPAHAGTAPCPPPHAQRTPIRTRVGQRVQSQSSTTRATLSARCFTKP
jgi:hypothetical protein